MGDLFNICVTSMTLYNLSVTLWNDNSEDQTDRLASCWVSHPLLITMFAFLGLLCAWHSNAFSTCGLSWCDPASTSRHEAGLVLFPCFSCYAFTCLSEADTILSETPEEFPLGQWTNIQAQ